MTAKQSRDPFATDTADPARVFQRMFPVHARRLSPWFMEERSDLPVFMRRMALANLRASFSAPEPTPLILPASGAPR